MKRARAKRRTYRCENPFDSTASFFRLCHFCNHLNESDFEIAYCKKCLRSLVAEDHSDLAHDEMDPINNWDEEDAKLPSLEGDEKSPSTEMNQDEPDNTESDYSAGKGPIAGLKVLW